MGCTGSKSLAMQARLEDWEDGPLKTTKSFVRSFSMPQRKPQHQYSGSSFSSVSMASGDGGGGGDGEYRNYSGNLQKHSGSLENRLENHSGSLHTVQLMSTSYGALRISDDEEQGDSHRAPPPLGSPPPAASLPKIPEAEVIDLAKLMRELDEEGASPRRRPRRQQQRALAAEWWRQRRQDQPEAKLVFGRSISSVASARELDAKIRAIVLALPNSRKKLRALESLQSIFCDVDDDEHDDDFGDGGGSSDSGSERSSSLQSRTMKGLFYGATLEESWSPSSCPRSPPRLQPPPLSPLHENGSQLPSGSCAASPLPAAVSTSTSSAGPPSSSEEEDPLFFDPASVESFQQAAESADGTAAAAAAEDTKCVSEESCAAAAATMRARRMQSSKVCSIDFEEQRLIPPGGENRVVLYVTSLRGVRKTFEDCNLVRAIVRGFGVAVDERDVAMHAEFRTELRALMEACCGVGSSTVVPRLFVNGDYLGGAEEVVALNEEGAIAGLLEGIPRTNGPDEVCCGCGGIRFVPCGDCRGSTKLVQGDGGHFTRCPSCNENGLVRCPVCL